MRDEQNPKYMFRMTHADLLAARGLDSTGHWVSLEKAKALHLIRSRRGTTYTRKGKKVSVSIPEQSNA